MKKLLLAGTAIVAFAATPAHAELDLDLGGYYYGYVGYVDQDNDAGMRDFDWRRDTEVHFKGETTLDNGLTVGVKVELETEQDAGAENIDENSLYFAGNWGKVILGSEDSAAYLLQVVAPAADELVDGYDPKFQFVSNDTTADTMYGMDAFGDSDKVTYITPKFNGFQAGVSFSNDITTRTYGNGLAPMSDDDDVGELENGLSFAARYDGEFEGVGIAFGGGYEIASLEAAGAGDDDLKEWNVGLSTSFDAFTLGVAYNEDNNALTGDNDSENWIIGANYEYGPYTFGASYFNGTTDVAGVEDELERYSVGTTYAFGPGMTFRGSVNVYDITDGTTPADSQDAVSVLLGTAVNF